MIAHGVFLLFRQVQLNILPLLQPSEHSKSSEDPFVKSAYISYSPWLSSGASAVGTDGSDEISGASDVTFISELFCVLAQAVRKIADIRIGNAMFRYLINHKPPEKL